MWPISPFCPPYLYFPSFFCFFFPFSSSLPFFPFSLYQIRNFINLESQVYWVKLSILKYLGKIHLKNSYIPYHSYLRGATALFGKVYRKIFQSKRRRLVFKTLSCHYVHSKLYENIFKYIFTYIYICYKIKHDMNIILCELRVILMRPLMRPLLDR